MSQAIILYLNQVADTVAEGCELDTVAAQYSNVCSYDLTNLQLATAKIILVVPSHAMAFFSIKHPSHFTEKHRHSLSYLLEDKVIPAIDQLHFVLTDKQNPLQSCIAVIERTLMQVLYNNLQRCAINTAEVVPDCLAIPLHANAWTLLLTSTHAIMRTAYGEGFSIEHANLNIFIQALLAEKDKPQRIFCYSTTEQQASVREVLHFAQIEFITISHPLQAFTENRALPECNLLQAAYRNTRKLAWQKSRVVLTTGLLFSCAMMYFINATVAIGQLRSDNFALTENISQLYKQAYPEATSVVSPKIRMTQTLDSYHINSTPFSRLLSTLAAGIHELPSIVLENINYTNAVLQFDFSADQQSQNKLARFLKTHGLHYQVLAIRDNNKVIAKCWAK